MGVTFRLRIQSFFLGQVTASVTVTGGCLKTLVEGAEDTMKERKATSMTRSPRSTLSQMAAEQSFNAQRFRSGKAAWDPVLKGGYQAPFPVLWAPHRHRTVPCKVKCI